MSVIVFGLGGHDRQLVKETLSVLLPEFAIALSADTLRSRALGQRFYNVGHEVLLDVPLESEFPLQSSQVLRSDVASEDLHHYFKKALDRIPWAVGVTHMTGSAFTKNRQSMQYLLDVCCQNKLFFLDTHQTPLSCAQNQGQEQGLFVIDSQIFVERGAVLTDALLRDSLRRKKSLIIAIRASRGGLKVLAELPAQLERIGAHLVPLSAQLSLLP